MANNRRNAQNKPLPRRWRFRQGWYRYRPHRDEKHAFDDKVEFYLGKTYSEAMAEFARRISYASEIRTIGQLLDRYEVEIVPTKASATQKSNGYSLKRLRTVFASVPAHQITLQDAFKYRDLCAKTQSPKKANLDIEVLSHVLTMAGVWGILNTHPLMNRGNIKLKLDLPARQRYVTDAELIEFGKLLPRKWQLYIMLKCFSKGRRKGELLRIRAHDLTEDGIAFRNNKNPNDFFTVAWSPALRLIVEELANLPPRRVGNCYLFATKYGKPYIKDISPFQNTGGYC